MEFESLKVRSNLKIGYQCEKKTDGFMAHASQSDTKTAKWRRIASKKIRTKKARNDECITKTHRFAIEA